jgi:hypothetical protein
MARRTHLVAALAVAVAGCDATEAGVSALSTAPDAGAPATSASSVPTATPFPDAGAGSGGPLADAGVAKRTVRWENPLGGPAGNLFVDGDVELSVGATGQMGVLAFDTGGAGQVAFPAETGGLCKSGLHCAVLERKTILFLRGAAAGPQQGALVRLAVKPPADQPCNAVNAVLVSCDTQAVVKKLTAQAERDEAGWCEHAATVPPRDYGLCLMVKSTLAVDQTALVDAARLVPDDGTVSPRKGEIWVPDAETARQLADIGDRIRRTMPFGRTPAPARDDGP